MTTSTTLIEAFDKAHAAIVEFTSNPPTEEEIDHGLALLTERIAEEVFPHLPSTADDPVRHGFIVLMIANFSASLDKFLSVGEGSLETKLRDLLDTWEASLKMLTSATEKKE